jgi:hypothetical protein
MAVYDMELIILNIRKCPVEKATQPDSPVSANALLVD